MQVVENVALISINATMVVQLVSFLIFMVLFNRVMIRPLRSIMTERQAFVQRVRDDVVAAASAFDEIARQIEQQESEARSAASIVREQLVEAGQQSVADVLNQTRKEISAMRRSAQEKADETISAARSSIQAEAEHLADQMVAALLDQRGHN